jgi:hypothetical protein
VEVLADLQKKIFLLLATGLGITAAKIGEVSSTEMVFAFDFPGSGVMSCW